jgi:hypothetical protein
MEDWWLLSKGMTSPELCNLESDTLEERDKYTSIFDDDSVATSCSPFISGVFVYQILSISLFLVMRDVRWFVSLFDDVTLCTSLFCSCERKHKFERVLPTL